MSWLHLHDGFAGDIRIQGLSEGAIGLLVLSASLSAQHQFDGRIPKKYVSRLRTKATSKKQAAFIGELIEEGLWVDREDYYEIPPIVARRDDPLIGHEHRDEIEEKRRKEAERKRTLRDREPSENRSAIGSVPAGHPKDSLRRPGREGAGEGRRVDPPKEQIPQGSDPWELQPEEKADPADLAAQLASFSRRPPEGGAR